MHLLSLVKSSRRHLAEDAKTKKIGIIGMGHVGKL
jgi:lactate dehydrogenase-like 2-hydroxyacid dehydrogenase